MILETQETCRLLSVQSLCGYLCCSWASSCTTRGFLVCVSVGKKINKQNKINKCVWGSYVGIVLLFLAVNVTIRQSWISCQALNVAVISRPMCCVYCCWSQINLIHVRCYLSASVCDGLLMLNEPAALCEKHKLELWLAIRAMKTPVSRFVVVVLVLQRSSIQSETNKRHVNQEENLTAT